MDCALADFFPPAGRLLPTFPQPLGCHGRGTATTFSVYAMPVILVVRIACQLRDVKDSLESAMAAVCFTWLPSLLVCEVTFCIGHAWTKLLSYSHYDAWLKISVLKLSHA